MQVLVKECVGCIGSDCVDDLLAHGHEDSVLDNLSTGSRDSVNPTAQLVEAFLSDRNFVFETFKRIKP
jgi:UDP-glucose 4-epimerase